MFFFFKQKTAYEMRISDWSSDVCSSDLSFRPAARARRAQRRAAAQSAPPGRRSRRRRGGQRDVGRTAAPVAAGTRPQPRRSEEHTSELQSLMRISYAVFCLKKKKTKLHTAMIT